MKNTRSGDSKSLAGFSCSCRCSEGEICLQEMEKEIEKEREKEKVWICCQEDQLERHHQQYHKIQKRKQKV